MTETLPVLAMDIGGTKIATAIISPGFNILARDYCPTQAEEGSKAVIQKVFSVIRKLLRQKGLAVSDLSALSLAMAGPIDMENGVVTASPNLPGWEDVPLKEIIAEKFNIATFLINDAKAAALGEYHLGAGRGSKNFVYITVSTGIGGGIIIDGKLFLGSSGSAGEIGHMTIDVNGNRDKCGNIGCLEMLASGTAVAREAIKRIKQGESSILTDMVNGNIENITAEKVSLAAERGDSLAQAVLARTTGYLGAGIVNLVNIFNPDIIVVGGGMSKMSDRLLDPVRLIVKERAFRLPAQAVRIVPAALSDDAGIFGAAIFAFQQLEIN